MVSQMVAQGEERMIEKSDEESNGGRGSRLRGEVG